ncbi:MAG: hypothetical protein QOI42_1151 [Frankiaceae bacterium]|nr:hypothetical protein [Frankiaceae bacterium]
MERPQPTAAPAPTVVVAMHDGFFGSGTGAGFANDAFLRTLVGLLDPGVRLVVLPIRLADDSPERRAEWHARSTALCAGAGATVRPVDNGTHGRTRFGGVDAFACAARDTATALRDEILPGASQLAVVLFDVPFAGVAAQLPPQLCTRIALVPRSTGLLHDVGNSARIAYESAGMRTLAEAGGRIAAISAYMRNHLRADYRLPDAALCDLPDGLTATDWRPPDVAPPPLPRAALAGFLFAYGRAQPYKGWDDLLDALALLRDRGTTLPHSVLAAVSDQPGVTDYQRHLAARVDALGLDGTLLTAFHPGMRGLLGHPALRAVVVPSRTEPFGRVPLEAYAAGGGPVVATTAGGLAEQVVDGVTGFTAAPEDPPALAEALGSALAMDDRARTRMRDAGHELARTRFDHSAAILRFFGDFAPWATSSAARRAVVPSVVAP